MVRLRPMPDARRAAAAVSAGGDARRRLSMHWQMGPFRATMMARLVLPDPVETLVLEVSLELDLTPVNAFDFLLDPAAGDLAVPVFGDGAGRVGTLSAGGSCRAVDGGAA